MSSQADDVRSCVWVKRTTTGSDRSQLANVAREAKAVLQVDDLEAIADRGHFNGEEILACEQPGICVTLPKPMTSGALNWKPALASRTSSICRASGWPDDVRSWGSSGPVGCS